MLSNTEAIATVAVRNLKEAAAFYESMLGLRAISREGDEVISYGTGSTVLNVYKSKFAGTNKATAATCVVGDRIDDVVDTLRSKGVVFEHYDLPGLKREGDIHVGEGMRAAWFKDPDGNIFNLVSG